MKRIYTTAEILERLRTKYSAPNYGFITQVRNGTGWSASPRTADAMAMSLWPSRGLHLMGFEVKASRSDWLNELKNGQKADDLAKYCDYWYLVVGDKDFVKEGELPKTWGLIAPSGSGMSVIVEAKELNADPIDHLFLAALFRNISDKMIPEDIFKSRVKGAVDHQIKFYKDENEKYKKILQVLDDVSGIRIDTWTADEKLYEIGKSIKLVYTGKHKKVGEYLKKLREKSENITKFIDDEIESLWL